jgi:hypothetical protein
MTVMLPADKIIVIATKNIVETAATDIKISSIELDISFKHFTIILSPTGCIIAAANL